MKDEIDQEIIWALSIDKFPGILSKPLGFFTFNFFEDLIRKFNLAVRSGPILDEDILHITFSTAVEKF